MFYKVHIAEIRSGAIRYKDETEEGEKPPVLNRRLPQSATTRRSHGMIWPNRAQR